MVTSISRTDHRSRGSVKIIESNESNSHEVNALQSIHTSRILFMSRLLTSNCQRRHCDMNSLCYLSIAPNLLSQHVSIPSCIRSITLRSFRRYFHDHMLSQGQSFDPIRHNSIPFGATGSWIRPYITSRRNQNSLKQHRKR